MKYIDLISPNFFIPVNNALHEKYKITRHVDGIESHIHFSLWETVQNQSHYKRLNRNWKARLSIHPDDIHKAWEIIHPFLYQKNISFKVVNTNVIEDFKQHRLDRLEQLTAEYNQFKQLCHSQDIALLKNNFHRLYQKLTAYENHGQPFALSAQTYFTQLSSFFYQHILSRESLITQIKEIYKRLIEIRKQKVKNGLRLYEGMQFTIYIPPGFEKECQDTLEEIEDNLLRADIRPGKIFPTDRQIGIYSSIRHPGKDAYHKATDADLETYNPDNLEDPFGFLKTIPTKQIIQEAEIQTILKNKTSPKIIMSVLQAKPFVSPTQLKVLATQTKAKESLVTHIKTLPVNEKQKAITDCLDKSSNLGRFVRVQRGLFSPRSGHGTLGQLESIGTIRLR